MALRATALSYTSTNSASTTRESVSQLPFHEFEHSRIHGPRFGKGWIRNVVNMSDLFVGGFNIYEDKIPALRFVIGFKAQGFSSYEVTGAGRQK